MIKELQKLIFLFFYKRINNIYELYKRYSKSCLIHKTAGFNNLLIHKYVKYYCCTANNEYSLSVN
jgi:hypothetical protein